jgi:hypothetical protein
LAKRACKKQIFLYKMILCNLAFSPLQVPNPITPRRNPSRVVALLGSERQREIAQIMHQNDIIVRREERQARERRRVAAERRQLRLAEMALQMAGAGGQIPPDVMQRLINGAHHLEAPEDEEEREGVEADWNQCRVCLEKIYDPVAFFGSCTHWVCISCIFDYGEHFYKCHTCDLPITY